MQGQFEVKVETGAVLCLLRNAVLGLDLRQALWAEGFAVDDHADPSLHYRAVILDIDDAGPEQIVLALDRAGAGVPVLIIGEDQDSAIRHGLTGAGWFRKPVVSDHLARCVRDLAGSPADGPEAGAT